MEGYLDDLMGQHLLFQILLFIVCISILLLFIVFYFYYLYYEIKSLYKFIIIIYSFLFLLFILRNKEYLLNKFQNKYDQKKCILTIS